MCKSMYAATDSKLLQLPANAKKCYPVYPRYAQGSISYFDKDLADNV